MTITKLRHKAERWRRNNCYEDKGGVVVFFQGYPQGWCCTLPPARHWRPGCVAVDDSGNAWVATGGNVQEGSENWCYIVSPPSVPKVVYTEEHITYIKQVLILQNHLINTFSEALRKNRVAVPFHKSDDITATCLTILETEAQYAG